MSLRVLLTAYGLFIIVVAALQVAFVVVAALNKARAEGYTKDFFHHTLRRYYTTSDRKDAVTLSWDFMMAELRCCGVEGYADFQRATEFLNSVSQSRLAPPLQLPGVSGKSTGSQRSPVLNSTVPSSQK